MLKEVHTKNWHQSNLEIWVTTDYSLVQTGLASHPLAHISVSCKKLDVPGMLERQVCRGTLQWYAEPYHDLVIER